MNDRKSKVKSGVLVFNGKEFHVLSKLFLLTGIMQTREDYKIFYCKYNYNSASTTQSPAQQSSTLLCFPSCTCAGQFTGQPEYTVRGAIPRLAFETNADAELQFELITNTNPNTHTRIMNPARLSLLKKTHLQDSKPENCRKLIWAPKCSEQGLFFLYSVTIKQLLIKNSQLSF